MNETTSSTETQSGTEVIKKMEDEHLRLQRQFREIQTDRLQRTMGVHPQFRSQDQLLRTLKHEYIDLSTDLKIARSGANKKNDEKLKSDLRKALLNRMIAENDCEGGLAIMEELDGLLQINNKEMMWLRKLANANRGELDARRWQSENRLSSAENKLEGAMLRFNAVQCENRKIRDKIEHMLRDRALFNQAWSKMLMALSTGKKFLSDLFESSTIAYDQRDEWCTKLRSVQEKGKMDQMLQVQEMRDLKKAYDHETKIYNFLSKKGVMRVNRKQEEKEAEEKRRKEEEEQEEFDRHLKILEDIYVYTQESSYQKIIETFEKTESENFSLYKLLTDYCAENEVLKRGVDIIRRDIEDRRDQNEMMATKRELKLKELVIQLEEQKIRTEALRIKNEEKAQILNGTMENVLEIFKMLDCSLEPYQNLLGDKQPSRYTLDLSMRLISEKIKSHVETIYYQEHTLKRKEKTSTSLLKKYTVHAARPEQFMPIPISTMVPADPCPSCIETRWLSRVSEMPETPFSREQVMDALKALAEDPAYVRSDRVHVLADCRATASRKLLATRHSMQY